MLENFAIYNLYSLNTVKMKMDSQTGRHSKRFIYKTQGNFRLETKEVVWLFKHVCFGSWRSTITMLMLLKKCMLCKLCEVINFDYESSKFSKEIFSGLVCLGIKKFRPP